MINIKLPFDGTLFLTGMARAERIKIRLLNGLYVLWSNKRLRSGMIILLIVAPCARYFFLLFPKHGVGNYLINIGPIQVLNFIETNQDPSGWYWQTLYYYFESVGELLAPTIAIYGVFLLFPRKYYPAYLMGIPFGFFMTNLLHRMFFVNSFESFHSGVTLSISVMLGLLGIGLFVVSDNVLFRQNKIKRVAEDRIIGLINAPNMNWNEKTPMIKNEVSRVMKVDDDLFLKDIG